MIIEGIQCIRRELGGIEKDVQLCKWIDLPNKAFTFTFTFMHLADAFIQSDLQCIQALHVVFLSVCKATFSN